MRRIVDRVAALGEGDLCELITKEVPGQVFATFMGHAAAHALKTLNEHPDQLAWLLEDFEGRADGAIDELLRLEPPLMHFRRTATRDYTLGGQEIRAGEKVVICSISSNRDEDVFADPDTVDLSRTRQANPHQAFGGGGPHYCLRYVLARTTLKSQLRGIYGRMKDLRVGEIEPLLSNFMNGVKRLPATWTPTEVRG